MESDDDDCDMTSVGYDLLKMMARCNRRGLRNSAMWAAELFHALNKRYKGEPFMTSAITNTILKEEVPIYLMAKSYFDNQEYDRAAFFSNNCSSSEVRFLHFYSVYCSGEKKQLDDVADVSVLTESSKNVALKSLHSEFQKMQLEDQLDGFCLYLYGVVLKKLKLDKQAVEILCTSVYIEPLNWGCWLELSTLVEDKEMLSRLRVPEHWMKNFFLAQTYLELQMNDLALDIYIKLMDAVFSHSTYLMAQVAIAHHNLHDLKKSIGGFQHLLQVDPYRLENLDIYSNLLYVREMKAELSNLATRSCTVDKYRVETCCVIGNFYSLRAQHEKAVLYFHRAVQLNPNYLSAWTLLGHEYMEMKNPYFAIQAYRKAIEVNKRDYRAWFGLGQTYETIKMLSYSLFYYMRAQQLRPTDSRMMVALGETYEKLDRYDEAKKCYWKAYSLGDREGIPFMKLGRLHERLAEDDQALVIFTRCIKEAEGRGIADREEFCMAYLYLAKYYYKRLNLEKSSVYARRCLDFPEVLEDGKVILRQIASRRAIIEEKINALRLKIAASERGNNSGNDGVNNNDSLDDSSPMNLTFNP